MPQLTAEQLKAVRTLDRNVAVSAGAGSGKTRVLTERFVHQQYIRLRDKSACQCNSLFLTSTQLRWISIYEVFYFQRMNYFVYFCFFELFVRF